MKLREVDMRVESRAGGEDTTANCRIFHVAQAIQQYLRNNPKTDAPCVKLLIVGSSSADDRARDIVESICQVDINVDVDALRGTYEEFRREAVRMAMRAIALFGEKYRWHKADLSAFVASLADADPICHARVDKLTKTDRHGNRLEVWLDVTERRTRITALVATRDGAMVSHALAECDVIGYIEDMLPARSVVGDGRRFQLRDKDRNVIAEVPVGASAVA